MIVPSVFTAISCALMASISFGQIASMEQAYETVRPRTFGGYTVDDCLNPNVTVTTTKCLTTPSGAQECTSKEIGRRHSGTISTSSDRWFMGIVFVVALISVGSLAMQNQLDSFAETAFNVLPLIGTAEIAMLTIGVHVVPAASLPESMVGPCDEAWAQLRHERDMLGRPHPYMSILGIFMVSAAAVVMYLEPWRARHHPKQPPYVKEL